MKVIYNDGRKLQMLSLNVFKTSYRTVKKLMLLYRYGEYQQTHWEFFIASRQILIHKICVLSFALSYVKYSYWAPDV